MAAKAPFTELDVRITFQPHPTMDKAHFFLNNLYSGVLEHPERLFTNPDNPTEFVDRIGDEIRTQIANDLVIPEACQTTDNAAITRIINGASLTVSLPNSSTSTRLTKQSITTLASNAAVHTERYNRFIEIHVSTAHIYFLESLPTYLDWNVFSNAADIATAAMHALHTYDSADAPSDNQSRMVMALYRARFDSCALLQHPADLRAHYIWFCKHLHREAASHSENFQGKAALLPSTLKEVLHEAISSGDDASTPHAMERDAISGDNFYTLPDVQHEATSGANDDLDFQHGHL